MSEGICYTLVHIGGPLDGSEVFSPRPLDTVFYEDRSVYKADEEGEGCLEWVDDSNRRITLKFKGYRGAK